MAEWLCASWGTPCLLCAGLCSCAWASPSFEALCYHTGLCPWPHHARIRLPPPPPWHSLYPPSPSPRCATPIPTRLSTCLHSPCTHACNDIVYTTSAPAATLHWLPVLAGAPLLLMTSTLEFTSRRATPTHFRPHTHIICTQPLQATPRWCPSTRWCCPTSCCTPLCLWTWGCCPRRPSTATTCCR